MADPKPVKNAVPTPWEESSRLPEGRARVASVVGLSLLEVIRSLDLPTEVLAAEDPSRTMPRRLGLSEVVDQQIRLFREQVRRRERITDQRTQDLFQLVLRRPDSDEAFLKAGEILIGKRKPLRGLKRIYPEKIRYGMARRETRRRIKVLFGRHIGGFAHGDFTLEARGHFLLDLDPGGDACALITGLCQAIASRFLKRQVRVDHSLCQARKQDLCRWVVSGS